MAGGGEDFEAPLRADDSSQGFRRNRPLRLARRGLVETKNRLLCVGRRNGQMRQMSWLYCRNKGNRFLP